MGRDGVDDVRRPFAAFCDRRDDRWAPLPRLPRLAERDHGAQVAHGRRRAVVIGLVDDEDVSDLEDPGLRGLDGISGPGREQDDRRVGERGDVHLRLADAHRLDEHDVETGGVEQPQCSGRRRRQPAEVAAGRHRADENPGITRVTDHADAVAEQRATGERRRGVDREHRDAEALRAIGRDECVRRRRLADAGRPRQTDDLGVARELGDGCTQFRQRRVIVLDGREQPREGAPVTATHPRDEWVDDDLTRHARAVSWSALRRRRAR